MLGLPDILVCGVGGPVGEAWMRGVLDGAAEGAGLDFRACEQVLGTSAGSIVGAALAAGRPPDAGREAAAAWTAAAGDTADDATPAVAEAAAAGGRRARLAALAGRVGAAVATPVAPLALAATTPGGAVLRAAALRALPRGTRSLDGLAAMVERLGARFDGRLRVVAVDLARGRRVVFGAPGAPPASVAEGVLASCAVPGLFAPVRIGEREYVDGGVWSPTNLDAAPATRGSCVLCLAPTAARGPWRAPTAAALGAESLALRSRGARVRAVRPDEASSRAMGPNLMDGRRSAAVLAAGYAQGRREAARGWEA